MSDSEIKLRDRQTELTLVIEAIHEVLKSKAWQILKELVLDRDLEKIERLLLAEAKSDEPSLKTLAKLQGELLRTRRYGDLKSYAEVLQKELQGIKDNLK